MRLFMLLPLCAGLVLAGCQKKQPYPVDTDNAPPSSVTLVPSANRSDHFAAVNQHLELGGTLYSYVDVDGDMLKLATGVRQLADNIAASQPAAAPFLKQDFAQIFAELGLTDIKAVGLSSVAASDGSFRNRVFFYAPQGRHGLLAGLGGPAAPYVHSNLAPADADLYSEAEVDLPAVYVAIKAVVARVAGETTANLLDSQLKTAGAQAGVSALEVIGSLKGRAVMVLRLDPEKNFTVPGRTPVVLPAFSLLWRIDGVGGALEKAIVGLPVFERSEEGTTTLFTFKGELPIEGVKPVLAIEDGVLYVATSPAFFQECRARKTGLGQDVEFQKNLALVGSEGNGLGYLTPRLFNRIRQLTTINPDAPAELKQVLGMIVAQVPEVGHPLIAERINLPDGILVRSHWNRSLKQDVAMVVMYNPVTIGVLAAMAIPAFQKVRMASQEKTIQNNLRQFQAAAERCMMENGTTSATYADVVGPDKYSRELTPVAGEDYRRLVVRDTDRSISVRTAAGKVVTFRW